ncbi:MAG: hypothetical protein O3A46_00400, partial [Candidatus Poribacteria bacterium]|nr:hypothetical protein [Candidatus Poribacteria bacterium]
MRLLRTANSGATWQTLASGLGNTFNFDDGFGPFPNGTYAICRQFRNVVYKQVSDSLHRSEDGGQTWDEIEVSFLNIDTSLDDVASSPDDPDLVLFHWRGRASSKGYVFRNVVTNETNGDGRIGNNGVGTFWTHPETGDVYAGYTSGTEVRGIVRLNFETISVDS